MRTTIQKSGKGLQARAVAGTYVVLLAFTCTKAYCKGLRGFAIQRKDHENGEVIWLRGLKKFDLPSVDGGSDFSTRQNPIQKFHWGDYTTKPGRAYTYTVHAMRGKPGALVDADQLDLEVTCEWPEQVGKNRHAVHFNRSAAASQQFSKRFPNLPKGEVVDPAARTWLSRGLEESLIAFIDAAQKGHGLHLFVYEFSKPSFLAALKAAKERGVRLEIIYDAMLDAKGKGPSTDSVPLIKKYGLTRTSRGRDAKGLNISHNKFMVLTDPKGHPKAVWTGSTNFTDGGVYGQSNVGHAVADPALAKVYLDWHQTIWNEPTHSAADSRTTVLALSSVPEGDLEGVGVVLSPRKSTEAITAAAGLVKAAQRMVCFTAPFQLHKDLQAALTLAPAQVFGLLNKDNVVSTDLHKAPNTQLAAAAALNDSSVLEAWQSQLLAESMQHSGVYIHSKILLIDPLSDHPVVISGSANFSTNSCVNNDENQLFIGGDTAVADVYLGEFMRMFDHYYFRSHVQDSTDPKATFLDNTDAWTQRFFGGDREALRLAFF